MSEGNNDAMGKKLLGLCSCLNNIKWCLDVYSLRCDELRLWTVNKGWCFYCMWQCLWQKWQTESFIWIPDIAMKVTVVRTAWIRSFFVYSFWIAMSNKFHWTLLDLGFSWQQTCGQLCLWNVGNFQSYNIRKIFWGWQPHQWFQYTSVLLKTNSVSTVRIQPEQILLNFVTVQASTTVCTRLHSATSQQEVFFVETFFKLYYSFWY